MTPAYMSTEKWPSMSVTSARFFSTASFPTGFPGVEPASSAFAAAVMTNDAPDAFEGSPGDPARLRPASYQSCSARATARGLLPDPEETEQQHDQHDGREDDVDAVALPDEEQQCQRDAGRRGEQQDDQAELDHRWGVAVEHAVIEAMNGQPVELDALA